MRAADRFEARVGIVLFSTGSGFLASVQGQATLFDEQ